MVMLPVGRVKGARQLSATIRDPQLRTELEASFRAREIKDSRW